MDTIETIVELELAKIQLRLMAFIYKLSGGIPESEDILQNVNMKLWAQRRAYDAAKPFFNWACAVAKFEVLRHRKTLARSRLVFSDAFVGEMADRLVAPTENVNRRLAFLEECRRELSGPLRRVVDWHYAERLSVIEIAKRLGRTAGSVAGSLFYARQLLRACVEGKTAAENRA